MINTPITICNKLGLHARAAAKFVTLAAQFECEIRLLRDSQQANGKSIMGVMMLAAGKGTQLVIMADGIDAALATEQLKVLVNERFGEAE